ncbi:MAG TPA: hypothetical protein PKD53_31910, partial [Chloroflexaceae bacterium]|nr:hypothetical protein [Chloroflexaceae bacterium]
APVPPPDPYRTMPLPDRDRLAPPPTPPPPARPRRWPAALFGLAALLAVLVAAWQLMGQERGAAGTAGPVQPTQPPVAAAGGGPPAEATPAPPTAPPAPPVPEPPLPTIAPPPPTAPPAPPAPEPPLPTAAPQQAAGGTIILDDEAWAGGYGGAGSPRSYGGRSATWVYGQGTGYETMRANFALAGQPAGTAVLSVEGMDSEGRTRTMIAVLVNGTPIYEGPNPLPDDDLPLETGTWDTVSWVFDAALLRPGQNEISITNRSQGGFSLPPFFMLDYAALTIPGE